MFWPRVPVGSRLLSGRFLTRAAIALSIACLLVVYAAVRATGGIPSPLTEFAYIAIACAVLGAGWRGGLVMGMAAGIALGPLMSTNAAAAASPFGAADWPVRFAAFVIAGATTGLLLDYARRLAAALDREAAERDAAELVRASEERLRRTIETSADGILILDAATRVVVVNAAAERILGHSRAELAGRTVAEVVDVVGAELLGPDLGPRDEGDVALQRGDGSRVLLQVRVTPLGAAGTSAGTALTLQDVTADRTLALERRTRLEVLEGAVEGAAGADSAAHAGRWLLAQLGGAWSLVAVAIYLLDARSANRLAVWTPPDSGGPLPPLVPESGADAVRALAREGVGRVPLARLPTLPGRAAELAARGARSLLVVPLHEGDAVSGVLLAGDRREPAPLTADEEADLVSVGHLAAAIVRRAEHNEEAARQRLHDRVARVLAEPTLLEPVFQPILAVRTGVVVGYEALARFRVEPVQPPNVWFAQAALVGLGAELEALGLRRAIEVALQAGLPPRTFLSLNVSPACLAHPAVAEALAGRSLERYVLELTEAEPVADYGALRRAMAPFLARGARFAVDDAGAGYASMRHVTEIRPAFVKLDAGLVRGLTDDRARLALVRALLGFSVEIGAQSIAEGVEEAADLSLLRRIRLPVLAQGYAIARPGPAWPLPASAALRGAGSRRVRLDSAELGAAG